MKNSNLVAAKRAKNDEFYTCRDVIKSLMEPVKRIGIINAFRNDAYVLELDSVSKNAEIVCEDIWKQFET